MYIYIYRAIYVYAGESSSVLLFFFRKVIFRTTVFFPNRIFTAATSKKKVRNCTTGEWFSVPSQKYVHFCPPRSGTVPNSLVCTVSNFFFVPCFPIFGGNYAFFGFKKELKTQAGTLVVQFVVFGSLISSITLFLIFKPFWSLVFWSFCVSFFLFCLSFVFSIVVFLSCYHFHVSYDSSYKKQKNKERRKEKERSQKVFLQLNGARRIINACYTARLC